ncbi:MAG: glutamyl-tRNA reductase, partial [Candidatus Latescibacterota bacterium]
MGRSREDSLFLIGISHQTAPVEIREKLSFGNEQLGEALLGIYDLEGVRECVVLSTCNRTEVYATLSAPYHSAQYKIEEYLISRSGNDSEISGHLYLKEGKQVIEHLFRVICSLDSMIIGEPQIFGQVKNAYSAACDLKTTGTTINRLFHHAFRVCKHIRNVTSIGQGNVSVSYAAVELAQKLLGSLENRTVLLAGAGKTGELCVRRLTESGVKNIFIANRTQTRASELAFQLGGEAVSFRSIFDFCETVDIIITSISAPTPIITRNELSPHIVRRNGKPLILIDLGVPRNIEETISDFENTYLYNIDDFENVILDNLDKRRMEVEKAEELIHQEVENFCCWLGEKDVIPVIRDLRNRCESIRQQELQRIRNRVSSETYDALD